MPHLRLALASRFAHPLDAVLLVCLGVLLGTALSVWWPVTAPAGAPLAAACGPPLTERGRPSD